MSINCHSHHQEFQVTRGPWHVDWAEGDSGRKEGVGQRYGDNGIGGRRQWGKRSLCSTMHTSADST